MLQMVESPTEMAYRLMELRAHIDQMELAFSELSAEFKQSGYWDNEGSNSALEWIRLHCHMTSNAAADRIAVGERAPQLAASAEAMRAEDIGFAHLTAMARTAAAVGDAL